MWHLMHRQIVMATMSPRWSVGTLLLITESSRAFHSIPARTKIRIKRCGVRFAPSSGFLISCGGEGMAETRKKFLCIDDHREISALIAEELTNRGFDVIVGARCDMKAASQFSRSCRSGVVRYQHAHHVGP